MTAQDKVKAIFPKAVAKKYKDNGGRSYYLIWTKPYTEAFRLASGKTSAEAWKNALKHTGDKDE